MHGCALRCVRSDELSLCNNGKFEPIVNSKQLKVLRNLPGYIITPMSRVVLQNITEIGSPILGGQIGEVLVFFKFTNTQTNLFASHTGHKYGMTSTT